MTRHVEFRSSVARGGGDASSRTNIRRLNDPDRTAREQATDATELNKIRVQDARVVGAGELVRQWRTEMGLNRRELADELRYVQSEVTCWESNRIHITLEDLQRLSGMAGKDLGEALRDLQSPEDQDIAVKWKGAVYSLDAFTKSTLNPGATVNYSQARQTYYLKLNPMANVEFHRGDIMMALLEKQGVQAIAGLTLGKGTRANIMKAYVECMDIKVGDKLNVKVLNVRKPRTHLGSNAS